MDTLGISYEVMGRPTHCCGVQQLRAGDLTTFGRVAENILQPSPRPKPAGSLVDSFAIGSPVLVKTSSVHSCCCFGGTTVPLKTARIQRSTLGALATAPPADCIQETRFARLP